MHCDERAALLSDYKKRTLDYRQAVTRLRKDGEPIIHSDFMLLWKLAKRALLACTDSQRRVEHHIMDHGCAGQPMAVAKSRGA